VGKNKQIRKRITGQQIGRSRARNKIAAEIEKSAPDIRLIPKWEGH